MTFSSFEPKLYLEMDDTQKWNWIIWITPWLLAALHIMNSTASMFVDGTWDKLKSLYKCIHCTFFLKIVSVVWDSSDQTDEWTSVHFTGKISLNQLFGTIKQGKGLNMHCSHVPVQGLHFTDGSAYLVLRRNRNKIIWSTDDFIICVISLSSSYRCIVSYLEWLLSHLYILLVSLGTRVQWILGQFGPRRLHLWDLCICRLEPAKNGTS